MDIKTIKNTIRVGQIVLGSKDFKGKQPVYHRKALELIYDKNFPRELKNKHVSIIYIFTVNSTIYKIGQSSGEKGISSCMNFYLKSGQDNPGINRFTINAFIRDEIKKGNVVEVYMVYMDLIEVKVRGLNKDETIQVPVSAKGMEGVFMKQYKSLMGKYPQWNYQENKMALPAKVSEDFAAYISKRAKSRS
jgi:hypothetical protein